MNNLITIIGPTASGKTVLAAQLANRISGEIISGDSRQVYRGMNIGTGKDLVDYTVDGKQIPYYIIDVVDAGHKYNVYEYQQDFVKAYNAIIEKGKQPILCGGTGMYIEAALKGYKLIHVPANHEFRALCESKTEEELISELKDLKELHNQTEIDNRRRVIRALEIEHYYASNPKIEFEYPQFSPILIGVSIDVETRRSRIDTRLKQRLDEGMVDEVKALIDRGVPTETLIYYGLEYKFLTQYILNQLTYDEMVTQLNIAIHQFAKRQMTWFRGMERRGMKIHWIDGMKPMNERVSECLSVIEIYGNER
jgi:tRNA dimethylallyltransferase